MPTRRLGWRPGWRGAATATLAGLCAFSACAQEAASEARQWLRRIQDAAANRSYQGTLTFSAGGALSSAKVAHYCDGKQRYERIETLDGQARKVLRYNDVVKTLVPSERVMMVASREATPAFPALPGSPPALAAAYDVQLAGVERIAGREAQVLTFNARDGLRYTQRLWADRASGLQLRSDILGAQGEVLGSVAFSDLQLDPRAPVTRLLASMVRPEGWREVQNSAVRTRLEDEGWALARKVPGFELVACLKLPMEAGNPVLQAVFSDGLTHVSLFVEPFDAKRHKPMRTMQGATHTQAQRQGDWWFTAAGDVPAATVGQFLLALQRQR